MIETIRIGGVYWKVEIIPDLRDVNGNPVSGLCDEENFRIQIKEEHPTRMLSTLLHEVIHAVCPTMPEKWVVVAERGLFAVMNDNPALRFTDGPA